MCDLWRPQNRGKKTKTSVEFKELPQGLIPLEPLAVEDEVAPAYPTVVQQARDNMREFEKCVLLTRVGGFYELYFEHAEEYGPLMNLKVAKKKTNAGPVSMAGFPFFHLDKYLKMLVQDYSRYVAIAEEFPNDASSKVKAGGLMHDRRISRVITPGTLIDENFMDPLSNNYVLAIHIEDSDANNIATEDLDDASSLRLGLAWLDLSTGHFFTQSSTLKALPSFLARTATREIVLDEGLKAFEEHRIFSVLSDDCHIISYSSSTETKPMTKWSPMLESPLSDKEMGFFTEEEVTAGWALLHYVETRLQRSNMKLQPPKRQTEVMGIDKNTMRALEIKTTIRENILTGSLLHTIRRTATVGGARMLENWLASPSTSLEVINGRLDLVTYLLEDETLRERVTFLLRRTHDSHRLLQKFTFGRGEPDDLLDLAGTVYATQDILKTLEDATSRADCVRNLVQRMSLEGPMAIAENIHKAIDVEGVEEQHRIEADEEGEMRELAAEIISTEDSSEGAKTSPQAKRKRKANNIREYYAEDNEAWIMKPEASRTLKRLHKQLSDLDDEREALIESLSESLGVTSLTLRFTPGLGYICHVKGKDIKLDLPAIRSVSSSKSTRSFHHPDWTSLGQRLDQCRVSIRSEEQRLFHSLREDVIRNLVALRRNASVLDELDIACAFASLALERRWTRPILNTSTQHKIIGGRHPTVESSLQSEGRTFISNDCIIGAPTQSLWLITGPNMAGKSTFLRQNALITILAQIGCYVPASYAELGIVDQIFSRVGSADNLYKDQSTFMVEMMETGNILREATKRSFVIMDEVGRGTTPEDGEAVAFAAVWWLVKRIGCRTLFASHFHGVVDLVEREGIEGVGFYCTDVEEDEKGGHDRKRPFRYVYKLQEAVNRKSHALKVARLAGLPEEAIAVASKVLEEQHVNM